ncbi:hypothetical protein ACFYM0_03855 [Streptomyces sp. NPDC006487]|uniref:hypothetical protein n=1 Tax=Streptomyces sp. NPDC006487 TaxID=3364748 RepID=UPI0036B9CE4B
MSIGQIRKRAGRAIAVAAACVAVTVAVTSPAEAAAPKTGSLTNAYAAPTPYSQLIGGIWSGAPVTMYCWVDSVWSNGTNRWFRVQGAGYSPYTGRPIMVTGYVSATKIVNQIRVGHC